MVVVVEVGELAAELVGADAAAREKDGPEDEGGAAKEKAELAAGAFGRDGGVGSGLRLC